MGGSVVLLVGVVGILAAAAPVAGQPGPGGTDGAEPWGDWDDLLRATYARDAGLAPYVVEALAARGADAAAWPDADDPVVAHTKVPGTGPLIGALRPMHALASAGHADADMLARIAASFDGQQYGDPSIRNDDIWALRTLVAAGSVDDEARRAASRLKEGQDASGGWAWAVGGRPDVDTTGMAAETLHMLDLLDGGSAREALLFLLDHQGGDGGFWHSGGEAGGEDGTRTGAKANCNSTVWGIRGLSAAWAARNGTADADDRSVADTREDLEGSKGETVEGAWQYLAGLRRPDGFSFRPGEPVLPLCTVEVLTIVAGTGHPLPQTPGAGATPGPALAAFLLALAVSVRLRRDQARRPPGVRAR